MDIESIATEMNQIVTAGDKGPVSVSLVVQVNSCNISHLGSFSQPVTIPCFSRHVYE